MDCNNVEASNDFKVDEGAFWHINMDLYYGYQPGEVVEVEHESNKYWLATIKYSFKHLVLLEWIGKYGEFWVDTSMLNSNIGSSITFDKSYGPKRLFPPGYHLQSQLKSQFSLACPTNALVKPSLYNPANDPYSGIKTVEDLLAHEIDNHNDDYANPTSTSTGESTSLVLAKCKTKIDFGQEDVDELEAALLNLNEIDSDDQKTTTDSTNGLNLETKGTETSIITEEPSKSKEVLENTDSTNQDLQESQAEKGLTVDNTSLMTCLDIQHQAVTTGRYCNEDKKVFYLKPKQFFDVGGANHERVLVPGTLLEVCYSEEQGSSLKLFQWFAIVLKNVGGRLTLRWFLCTEPKFKQGRIELKSNHSEFIKEDYDDDEEADGTDGDLDQGSSPEKCISAVSITFCLHFCNPRIHSIGYASETERIYKMPHKMLSSIENIHGKKVADYVETEQISSVFDQRRMNLDKDRPIIDHLLSTVRWKTPHYVDLAFSLKDKEARREVLISTPKATKLLRAYVKKELEACIYEVESDPLYESDEIVKFIHPYDTSHCILPLDWAINNQDCLSVPASRNHTPSPATQVAELVENIKNEVVKINECPEVNVINGETKSETIHADLDGQKSSADMLLPQPVISITCSPKSDNIPKEPVTQAKQLVDSSDATMVVPYLEAQKQPLYPEKRKQWIQETSNLQLQCEIPRGKYEYDLNKPFKFDERDPSCWTTLLRTRELLAEEFRCSIDYTIKENILAKFKVMDQLEVVHPSSDSTICLGRIRKVVYPLLWIQISPDSYTLLPFNSTDIYPSGWCETNNHPLLSLLPIRKRLNQGIQQPDKKRKRFKNSQEVDNESTCDIRRSEYEKEHFDLTTLNDKQLDIDSILNQKSTFIRIYFNHKCFTGPSLSKGKICSLPQYVGPGPLRLVMEEVITKVISVAYVPPRILNDLSSKPFEELLVARGLSNTTQMEFKAKYQKRVHREDIPVCLNLDDIALYCECVCEHLKCCYNLFGPNLYDGDDCPGHCRALTKSNKFMKRATYYREKARLGEFLNDGSGAKKTTSRARYSGRESSESNSSNASRSEQVNSRASATCNETPTNDLKENLVAVDEELDEEPKPLVKDIVLNQDNPCVPTREAATPEAIKDEPEVDKVLVPSEQTQHANVMSNVRDSPKQIRESEFGTLEAQDFNPENWTTTDVVAHLESFRLGCFTPHMLFEHVDGQALILLDRVAIKEHFKQHPKASYTPEEVGKLCRFVEFVKTRVDGIGLQA